MVSEIYLPFSNIIIQKSKVTFFINAVTYRSVTEAVKDIYIYVFVYLKL